MNKKQKLLAGLLGLRGVFIFKQWPGKT